MLLFLGQLSPEDVLAAAVDKDPVKRREQTCEARLYNGQWALQRGDRKDAVRQFRAATKECSRNPVEQSAAQAELQALP